MAGWIHQAPPITEEQLSVFTGIRNLSAPPPVLLSATGLTLPHVPAVPAVFTLNHLPWQHVAGRVRAATPEREDRRLSMWPDREIGYTQQNSVIKRKFSWGRWACVDCKAHKLHEQGAQMLWDLCAPSAPFPQPTPVATGQWRRSSTSLGGKRGLRVAQL